MNPSTLQWANPNIVSPPTLTNYDKRRAEVYAKALNRAKEENTQAWDVYNDDVEDIGVCRALAIFDTEWEWFTTRSTAIDDAVWEMRNLKKLNELIFDKPDYAELGRIFSEACNKALVDKCVEDGFDQTAEEREWR